MIIIGILGEIGSGKSYVARNFGYPVFNADYEVAKLYQKNKNSKIVILDIPLLLENKINNKDDLLVYVQASKFNILKRLKKRKNFNKELIKKFKAVQLPISYKKTKSHYIIKNNFTKKSVKNGIKSILRKIR